MDEPHKRILVNRADFPFPLDELASLEGPTRSLVIWDGGELPRADALLGTPPPVESVAASGLDWVHLWSAGVDKVAVAELGTAGVAVTTSKGNGASAISEHALFLLLATQLGAPAWIEAQRAHLWSRHRHNTLAGTTCGIVGMGNIGRALARVLIYMGVRVIGMTRSGTSDLPGAEIVGRDGLGSLLSQSDSVVVTAPLTAETRGMIGSREFELLRPGAVYVCVSRGGIADDDALLQALRNGTIRAAGLDAHAHEPLPSSSPFWALPNVLITPHNGGTTPQTLAGTRAVLLDNLGRYTAGRPLRNLVTKFGY